MADSSKVKRLPWGDLGYILFLALFFPEVFFKGARFIGRDLLNFQHPLNILFHQAARGKGSFLWDGSVNHGMPLLGRWTSGLGYPAMWLNGFLKPFDAMTILIIIHIYIAAAATMRLARRYVDDDASAWLAGLNYGFGGYVLTMIGGSYYLFGAALLPLGVLCLLRILERPTLGRTVGFVFVLGMQMTVPDPQTVYYFLAVLAPSLILAHVDGWTERGRRLVRISVAACLAAALAFYQLWPALEYMSLSVRKSGLDLSEVMQWSLHPARLAELVVPHFFGAFNPEPTFWVRWIVNGITTMPWAIAFYAGALPLIGLACLKLRPWRPAVGSWGGMTVFFIILALGKNTPVLPLLVRVLPLADRFRYPEKFLLFASLGISILGAMGISGLFKAVREPRSNGNGKVLIKAMAVILFLIFVLAVTWMVFSPKNGSLLAWLSKRLAVGINLKPWETVRTTRRAIIPILASLAALAAILIASRWGRLRSKYIVAGLVLAAVLDIWHAGKPLKQYGRVSWLNETPAIGRFLAANYDGRVYMLRNTALRFKNEAEGIGPAVFLERQRWWEWNTLDANIGIGIGIYYADGYDAVLLDSWKVLLNNLNADPDRLVDVIGANVLVGKPGELTPDKYPLLATFAELRVAVYANNDALPYVYAVAEAEAADGMAKAAARVAGPDFPFHERVVLERGGVLPNFGPADRGLTILEQGHGRIKLAADFDAGGYLVVLETFYPGWRAFIDGAAAEISRANGHFMGLMVPAGAHEIRLEFRPRRQTVASAVSLSALVLTLALAVVAGTGRSRPRDPRATK